jgi:hypothetical protein
MRGIRAMEKFVDWARVAKACSTLVGDSLLPHPLRAELTHVNIQTHADRPVDFFHHDRVPFVSTTRTPCVFFRSLCPVWEVVFGFFCVPFGGWLLHSGHGPA